MAGRYGEALGLALNGLSQHPDDCELLFARASVLFDWGRIREARAGFLRAEAKGLSRTALHLNLAWSCHLLHRSDEAESHARKAVELDPSVVATHFGLGTILQRQKRYPAAIASYERALQLAPDYGDAAAAISHCKLEQRDYPAAEVWMRRGIALRPEQPHFWNNLGVALASQARYAEAFEALRHAGELESAQGGPIESVVDHGFTLILTGQDREAAELYQRNLPQLPDPRAHGHYALTLLMLGLYREGWEQYEFRWLQEPHLSHRPAFVQPPWAGQNLTGKTILLRSEQGAGDIIQFARFAVPIKALGATVVLEVRPEHLHLAQGFAGVDRVFAAPTPPPPFDYYIHLMSIPHVLGTELATVPAAVPYLRVDPVRSQSAAARIADKRLKVGLAWAGNPSHLRDRERSMPLEALRSLWQLQGIRYFSLQKPLRPGELEQFPTQTTLVNLGPDLVDFADTAAVIAQLDLVVCVDTAIAHLAGALGKPVWLLLPQIGDFRWLKARDDSPWYPTMRLFRQQKIGQWDEVVERVKVALQEAVRAGSSALLPPLPPLQEKLTVLVGEASIALHAEAGGPESKRIARVTETRYGIMQYIPEANQAARSIAWYGEFLQPQLDLIACMVRPGAHVVEIGSGIGAHALSLAQMVGSEGHLFTYEPRPVVQRVLLKNLEVNRAAENVTMLRRALAGPVKRSPLIVAATSSSAEQSASSRAEEITDTLDELVLERLDLLKIQAGAAAAILEGASATLWRLRPVALIAAENLLAVRSLADQMAAFGYRCWKIETPFFNPRNFNCRETDIFDGELALALLAIPEELELTFELDGCVEVTDRNDPRNAATNPQAEPIQATTLERGATGANAASRLLRSLRKLLP
jgi:FkbM family methyltransferase